MRTALFVTCFNDTLFPGTGRAMVRLLERLGCTVDFPLGQTCCGQMHFNTGYQRECVPLVRRFTEVFEATTRRDPSGSCAAMVREYHGRVAEVAGDTRLAAAVRHTPPVYELSEFLVDVLGVVDVGAYFPHRVTYHPLATRCGCSRRSANLRRCCGPYVASTWWSCRRPRSAAASAAPSR